MIAVLVGPVATETENLCAASVSGARIPVLTLYCRRSRDVASLRFARLTVGPPIHRISHLPV